MFLLGDQVLEDRGCISHLPFLHLVQYLPHSRCSLLCKYMLLVQMATQIKSKYRKWPGLQARNIIVGDDLIANNYLNDSQCVNQY